MAQDMEVQATNQEKKPEEKQDEQALPFGRRQCPRCKGGEMARSRSAGLIDKFMERFGYKPYRCRRCKARRYRRRF